MILLGQLLLINLLLAPGTDQGVFVESGADTIIKFISGESCNNPGFTVGFSLCLAVRALRQMLMEFLRFEMPVVKHSIKDRQAQAASITSKLNALDENNLPNSIISRVS